MSKYLDPRYSVALLNVLNLSDEEHKAIHHRGHEDGITPASHVRYCEGIRSFKPGSNNVAFARKLEKLMLERLYANACR